MHRKTILQCHAMNSKAYWFSVLWLMSTTIRLFLFDLNGYLLCPYQTITEHFKDRCLLLREHQEKKNCLSTQVNSDIIKLVFQSVSIVKKIYG